jgi:transposase
MPGADAAAGRHRCHRQSTTLRYLPPYSPDLNPIEQSFAKIKADLRKAKQRTIPALYDRIGRALNTFALTEFPSYFRNAGYAST